MFRGGWTIALAGLVSACEREATNDCEGTASGVVEVGTGTDAFAPLGATLAFYQGPQGGYHVFGAVRTENLYPGDPSDPFGPDSPVVSYRLYLDGAVVGQVVEQPRYLESGGDGSLVSLGQVVVIADPNPLALDGRAVELEATVEDRCGVGGTDRRPSALAFTTTE